jgi:cell wall assembly regulator SMI1
MIDGLIDSLSTIEDAIRDLGRAKVLQLLQPGISADRVRASLEGIGLRSTEEIEALYAWHDGIADTDAAIGQITLWPGFYFTSLEETVANYQAFVDDPRWTPGWLPMFANGGGDFYVVDLSSPGDAPVRHFRIDEHEQPVEFMSLTSMFATLEEAFRRRYFSVTTEGSFRKDYPAFGKLAAEMNPDVEWWRS